MTFIEAVKHVLTNYAKFSGRARRSEYWYFFLFNFVVSLILGYILPAVSSVYSLAVLIPTLAVSWRRLHDIGKAGGWYFICLVPIVGWILLLVWLCKDSQPGENQYGPNPKDAAPAGAAYAGAAPSAPAAEEEDEFAKAMKAFEDMDAE